MSFFVLLRQGFSLHLSEMIRRARRPKVGLGFLGAVRREVNVREENDTILLAKVTVEFCATPYGMCEPFSYNPVIAVTTSRLTTARATGSPCRKSRTF